MKNMNIDDDSYINKLKELREEEQSIIDNNKDIDFINRLNDIRKEEQLLIDRLIEERFYLANESKIDPLTGLYNRKILPKVRDIGTVIMCDIDNFKGINDTFGHQVGDDALRAVGQSISHNIRIGDIGCRFGGDEFIIIFTTDIYEVIDSRMKKIVEDVNKIIEFPDRTITMSIGVAFNKDHEDLATLMQKADKALYESKENGKNQISYYDSRTLKR